MWPTGNFQGIDITKLAYWDQTIGLYKKEGKIWPDAWYGQGQHPTQVQYTSGIDTRDFAEPETQWLTALPTNHNADTLGIRPDLIGRPIESWGEFINPEFEGKTALQGFPQIGLMDLAMAIEAQGMMTYGNKGNMTQDEIDQTIDFLIELKRKGHFPRVLAHLQRIGEPDALRRGRDPVDVVAGGDRGPLPGGALHL